MLRVKVFGRAGSDYMKAIRKHLGNHPIRECHVAVNYGLQGGKLDAYMNQYPAIRRLPILNERQAGNKYECVKLVAKAGVPVPDTYQANEKPDNMDGRRWIIKPYYSLGGRDIEEYQGEIPNTHYLQERIDNRRYEVRVHAFAWTPPEKWVMQRRVHPDGDNQLAWNEHQGGKFITINNTDDPLFQRIRESTKKAMGALGYQFGAADWIIQNPGARGAKLKHYFVEWNLAPGWTLEHIKQYYMDSFKAIEDVKMDDIHALLDGCYPWLPHWGEPQPNAVNEEIGQGEDLNPPLEQQPEALREAQIEELWRQHDNMDGRDINGPVDDDDRYAEVMAERQIEMNFCPQCGRPVNEDIFGALPRFCPGCGSRVRR